MAYESMVHPANMALGQGGVTVVNTTTQYDGDYHMFTVIGTTGAVFTTLTGNLKGDALGATSFPLGATMMGQFTTVKLASGAIWLYDTPTKP